MRYRRKKRRRRRIIALTIIGAFIAVVVMFGAKQIDFANRLIYLPSITLFGRTFGGNVLAYGSGSVNDLSGTATMYDQEISSDLENAENSVEDAVSQVGEWAKNTRETAVNGIKSIDKNEVGQKAENVLEAIVNGYFHIGNFIIDNTNGIVPTYEELEEKGKQLNDLELPDSYEDVKEDVSQITDVNEGVFTPE